MCLCYVYAYDSLKMIVYNHMYLYITCPTNDSLKMIVYNQMYLYITCPTDDSLKMIVSNHLSVAYSKTCAFHIVETCVIFLLLRIKSNL